MAYTNYTYVSNRILNVNDPEHLMTTEKSKANQFGLGVGAGYRWITKGAWSFELGAVVGRNLLNNDAPNVYWNTIFSIGKRF